MFWGRTDHKKERKGRHESTQALESTKNTAAGGHRSQRGKFTIMSLVLGAEGTSLKTLSDFHRSQKLIFSLVFISSIESSNHTML